MSIQSPQSLQAAEAPLQFVQETLHTLLSKTTLRQWEIAQRLGCTQPHVSYLLHSKAPNARPSATTVEALRTLRAEYAHVFEETPEPQAA